MLYKDVIDLFEMLDAPTVSGEDVKNYMLNQGAKSEWITVSKLEGSKGSTDFIKILVPGFRGKFQGGEAPTLGVIGRLGGIGARPDKIGFVSDGDGALACLGAASKALKMHKLGDVLPGDVVFSTHICPDAPTTPHEPVDFMGSPVNMDEMNAVEVDSSMDAILSIDTTKGNRIISGRGIAISPTVKEGYILQVSEGLLDVLESVTGASPKVFALANQDITPYGNNLHHLNSILQPATATASPVVGVAIISDSVVAGCATGATQLADVEMAGRFAIEVAKIYPSHADLFINSDEFASIVEKYGSMTHLQSKGEKHA